MLKILQLIKIYILIFNFDIILCDQYDDLINQADIFYLSPNPRKKINETRIDHLHAFNNQIEIKIIIHGYYASRTHYATSPIRYAYLSKGYTGVFAADWKAASEIFYPVSRYFIVRIAKRFYDLIYDFIRDQNIPPQNVHLIGHSLGAHISGIVGRYFNGKIGRITALDPASPLFEKNAPDAIQASDALFVDVIHSDDPVLGSLTPRGHVDFYPNYGGQQPGCGTLDLITLTACSHYRAPLFFAESVLLPENFPSIQCPFENIRRRKCKLNNTDIVYMGENLPRNARGFYYLRTNDISPFGMGQNSKILSQLYPENNVQQRPNYPPINMEEYENYLQEHFNYRPDDDYISFLERPKYDNNHINNRNYNRYHHNFS